MSSSRFLGILVFFLVAISVLLGLQFFVYWSIVELFSLADISEKTLVYAVTAAIPVGFILSSALGRGRENIFTKYFYVSTGILLGIGVNVVLACLAAWGVLWISEGDLAIAPEILAGTFFLIAIAVSVYGVWNASHPIVKYIEAEIPRLPEMWKGKRIVQLSDIHLGYVYQTGFMRRIVEQVNGIRPEAVMITGDLFDGMDGNFEHAVELLDEMRAPQGIFFVSGNHETYFGLEKSLALLRKTSVRVLDDEVIDIAGLKVIGIGYPDLGVRKDIVGTLESLGKFWRGHPNIFLYHAPTNIDKIRKLGINLQLSGHTHKGQLFPFNFVTNIVHRGHDYGLYTDGSYTLYTTSGIGTWGPSMRLGNRPEIVVITLL